ncbi:hypothetical protein JZ751_008930 [Albula glossodonta]|uniref:STIM1/2 EF-hand domain-containing protein n=1 Tax=Albula glossodonta TaxID=121402 RepID=A0A8T2NZK9_9TELE|nr:hypothetical protein JZ751_008930 [Albula glossodonta]
MFTALAYGSLLHSSLILVRPTFSPVKPTGRRMGVIIVSQEALTTLESVCTLPSCLRLISLSKGMSPYRGVRASLCKGKWGGGGGGGGGGRLVIIAPSIPLQFCLLSLHCHDMVVFSQLCVFTTRWRASGLISLEPVVKGHGATLHNPCLTVIPQCVSEADRFSLEALRHIHKQLDDDNDGGIEVNESVELGRGRRWDYGVEVGSLTSGERHAAVYVCHEVIVQHES